MNRLLNLQSEISRKSSTSYPKGKGTKPSMKDLQVNISYAPGAERSLVSAYSLSILKALLKKSGNSTAVVASTSRTPGQQARVMYTDLEKNGVEQELNKYADGGDAVIRVYEQMKMARNTKEQTIEAMKAEILRRGPEQLAGKLMDPQRVNYINLNWSSLSDPNAFKLAAKAESRISRMLPPLNREGSIYLEIPQPGMQQKHEQSSVNGKYSEGIYSPALSKHIPPANPDIKTETEKLAKDDLIMTSYKGMHDFTDNGWGFFFSKNSGLSGTLAKPNWKNLVSDYNSANWKYKKVLQMISRDMLGKKLSSKIDASKQKDVDTLKEAYDSWKEGYYAVFWGSGHVCNLLVGEAVYLTGQDFLNSVKHYHDPKGMNNGANGKLVKIEFDQVEPGDFFTYNGVHTGVIVEKSGDTFKTREGTVNDAEMGKLRERKNSSDFRYFRYRKSSAAQSLMVDLQNPEAIAIGQSFQRNLFGFQQQATEYRIVQPAYLPAEGVGINGSYTIYGYFRKNTITNPDTGAQEWKIWMNCLGKTAASRSGKVRFSANAELLVNGVSQEIKGFVDPGTPGIQSADSIFIGDAEFVLPVQQNANIQIKVTGGYIFSAPGGGAAPLPPTTSKVIDVS